MNVTKWTAKLDMEWRTNIYTINVRNLVEITHLVQLYNIPHSCQTMNEKDQEKIMPKLLLEMHAMPLKSQMEEFKENSH